MRIGIIFIFKARKALTAGIIAVTFVLVYLQSDAFIHTYIQSDAFFQLSREDRNSTHCDVLKGIGYYNTIYADIYFLFSYTAVKMLLCGTLYIVKSYNKYYLNLI